MFFTKKKETDTKNTSSKRILTAEGWKRMMRKKAAQPAATKKPKSN
jgi:hypothetical protein